SGGVLRSHERAATKPAGDRITRVASLTPTPDESAPSGGRSHRDDPVDHAPSLAPVTEKGLGGPDAPLRLGDSRPHSGRGDVPLPPLERSPRPPRSTEPPTSEP